MFFGATVTVGNAQGEARTVAIVGVDEIDTARGYISWVSPMARALLKAREGDTVTLAHAGRRRGASTSSTSATCRSPPAPAPSRLTRRASRG